jgi:hypothetical protein
MQTVYLGMSVVYWYDSAAILAGSTVSMHEFGQRFQLPNMKFSGPNPWFYPPLFLSLTHTSVSPIAFMPKGQTKRAKHYYSLHL